MPGQDLRRRAFGLFIAATALLLTNACTQAPKDNKTTSPGDGLPVVSSPADETVRVLLKSIEEHLEEDPSQVQSKALAKSHPELHPKTFCSVNMVELRGDGSTYLAGVYSQCQELARKGKDMVAGTGSAVPQVARLEMRNSTPRFISLDEPQDGGNYQATLRKMFTEEGVRKILSGTVAVPMEKLHAEARKTFNLPADAKVIDL